MSNRSIIKPCWDVGLSCINQTRSTLLAYFLSLLNRTTRMKELNVSPVVMSSVEIATLCEKEHKNVLADIRKIFEEVGIRTADFSALYLSSQNKNLPCYNLPRRECDLIVAGYSAKYRLAIIDRWIELENKQPKPPQTKLEWIRFALEQEQEVVRLEAENQKLNRLIDNEFGYCSILRAAIYLGVHESTFQWQTLKARTIQLGYEVKRVPSPRFAYQNLYHMQAFRDCYPSFDFDDLTPELVDDKAKLTLTGKIQ